MPRCTGEHNVRTRAGGPGPWALGPGPSGRVAVRYIPSALSASGP